MALRSLGQAAELGELLRELVQPLRFCLEHLDRRRRPTVRLSDRPLQLVHRDPHGRQRILDLVRHPARHLAERAQALRLELALARGAECRRDRKSTRLDSSHMSNSYAVFCLKKKKKNKEQKYHKKKKEQPNTTNT